MAEEPQRSEKAKMLAGELYRGGGPELAADALRAARLTGRLNRLDPDDDSLRTALLTELCGFVGEGVVVRPPFACDYGFNIRVGARSFVNFGCVFLDVAAIEIGCDCQIGPSVQIYTADHPRDPNLRRQGLESGLPVRVGDNVWIGGGAILLPGVSIGEDAIIGAGSVVTRDVAPGATVGGNPAVPLRRRR